jgi:transposase-like protein
MSTPIPSTLDLALAKVCANCPVCRHARRRQRGPAFWLVKRVETKVCPFCRAYERVHGRKSHEPVADSDPSPPEEATS